MKRAFWFLNTFKYLFPSMTGVGFGPEVDIILKVDEKLTKFRISIKDYCGIH